MGLVWWEPCLWGFASFGRQFWASFGGSCVYGNLQLWSAVLGLVWWEPCFGDLQAKLWSAVLGLVRWEACLCDLQALIGSDGPRLVGSPVYGDLQALVGSLVGAVPMGICSFGRQFWAWFGGSRVSANLQALVGSSGPRLVGDVGPRLVGASRVYGDLQLWSAVLGLVWSAVMGLVWREPCLWGFAALVGSDGPRLAGAVSMRICSFGRQFWASFGGSRVYADLQALVGSLVGAVYGDLQLWSAVLGLVWWEPCLCGFASFGRQFWASFGGSRVYENLQALVGSDGPRLVGTVSTGICRSAVMGEPWGFASFGRQFWASFGGSRVYVDLQALVGSSGPRLVGAVSMAICKLWSAVLGLVWWEPCLWGFASFGRQFWASFGGSRVYGDLQALVGSSGPCLVGAVSMGICNIGQKKDLGLALSMGLVWWEPCLWGFAALVGSDGPRLVGAVSMMICSFGRQFWEPCLLGFAALVGSDGPRLVGAVSMRICKLWSAVLGLVWWEPCLLVGSDGPRLVGAVSTGICRSAVMGEPCLWGFASFVRQFWASFGGSRVYVDLQALVGSSGPRLVGAVSMAICTGLVWWEPCLWGFAS